MINKNIDQIINEFVKKNKLPQSYNNMAKTYLVNITNTIYNWSLNEKKPICIGINGAQGTGKSTLSLFIKNILEEMKEITVEIVSIDDLYHTKNKRLKLSSDIHNLFITRGAPGTHDISIGYNFINACLNNNFNNLHLPRFDKFNDDRSSKDKWLYVNDKIDIIILEGWCVGAKPQKDYELKKPINSLEEKYDSKAIWRTYSNDQLKNKYQSLFNLCSYLIMIKAPSFEVIYEWRLKQERVGSQKSEKNRLKAMNKEDIKFFVQHFERLSRWMMKDLPNRSDILIKLNNKHLIEGVNYR